MAEVTRILEAAQRGDAQAAADLLAQVYNELRKLAAARLAKERPGNTLQATALVHEAYLRLHAQLMTSDGSDAKASKAYFFAAAAQAMHRILIEAARHKSRVKHGGGVGREHFELDQIQCGAPHEKLLDLQEALQQLALESPEKAQLVELRFFAGLGMEEAAEVLGISSATAKRHWRYARAWLGAKIEGEFAASIAEEKPNSPFG